MWLWDHDSRVKKARCKFATEDDISVERTDRQEKEAVEGARKLKKSRRGMMLWCKEREGGQRKMKRWTSGLTCCWCIVMLTRITLDPLRFNLPSNKHNGANLSLQSNLLHFYRGQLLNTLIQNKAPVMSNYPAVNTTSSTSSASRCRLSLQQKP